MALVAVEVVVVLDVAEAVAVEEVVAKAARSASIVDLKNTENRNAHNQKTLLKLPLTRRPFMKPKRKRCIGVHPHQMRRAMETRD